MKNGIRKCENCGRRVRREEKTDGPQGGWLCSLYGGFHRNGLAMPGHFEVGAPAQDILKGLGVAK